MIRRTVPLARAALATVGVACIDSTSPSTVPAVAFAFRYGADSVPAKYMGAWAQARTKTWVVSRVRTYVAPVARNGYFDFTSTFDVPTPPSP